ncbi:MAG TPA: hypothetical protein VNA04_03565 [Thermoanaerobaculia bacterium]|nr:hypothetical protein [Thermoanaerobaculia bacterium]
MRAVSATARYGRAIASTADLLTRLRLDFMFVGTVARSAWLGSRVESGSLEVLALMAPQQKNQVAMMASNRGYRVDREEVEQSEELDLVPLNFLDGEGEVRVHVLVASNALYGRMLPAAVAAGLEEGELKVAAAEDLALLLAVADDAASHRDREMLIRLPEFDRRAYNRRLVSIGLPDLVIAE